LLKHYYADQAAHCREEAGSFAGEPEEKLLLSVAMAFDELARSETGGSAILLRKSISPQLAYTRRRTS
jgi:hypothetical protein